jgi:hypothetical protein
MQINSKLSLQIILFLILGLVALLKSQHLEETWEKLCEEVSSEMQQAQMEMERLERNTLHLKKRSVLKTASAGNIIIFEMFIFKVTALINKLLFRFFLSSHSKCYVASDTRFEENSRKFRCCSQSV